MNRSRTPYSKHELHIRATNGSRTLYTNESRTPHSYAISNSSSSYRTACIIYESITNSHGRRGSEGDRIITTVKISNKSSGSPRIYETRFRGSPQNFKQGFTWVDRVPLTQKIYPKIGWKFEFLRERCIRMSQELYYEQATNSRFICSLNGQAFVSCLYIEFAINGRAWRVRARKKERKEERKNVSKDTYT